MMQGGLRQVSNPSELLLTEDHDGLSGVAISAAIEGVRPFLVETQALVSTAAYGTPQRSATGFDQRRLNMLLAVLEKRVGFKLMQKDVFLKIAGGLKVTDPAMDLSVLAAVFNSNVDTPIEQGWCMAGEVGLSGEVRPVSRIEQRIAEAEKLGFQHIIIPKYNNHGFDHKKYKIEIHPVRKVEVSIPAACSGEVKSNHTVQSSKFKFQNSSKMKDSVIIVSGGMDSITLLYDKKDEIALGISFNYGSNHNEREIPFAKMHCERLGIKHITIDLGFMHQYFKSSLLEGADAIPEGHYAADNMKSTVVPFRNGIMLSIAIGIAESNKLKKVFIANHGGDHTIYPDCRPEFIKAIDEAAEAGTFVDVRVVAPYTNITKGQIAEIGKKLGIDYAETWSCYKGGEKHCGKCGTCVERKEALAEAGIEDTTEYEE